MDFAQIAFLLFATVATLSAIAVISLRNPVHAVLSLVLTFFSISCTWIVAGAEFLGITLILVYVGAVMVLFLFVVMMLDINTDSLRQNFWRHFPLAGLVGALIALEMTLVLRGGFDLGVARPLSPTELSLGNTKLLGIEVYTNYLYPLQLAAVLLLVAIVAAIALTLRERKDSRHQGASQQIRAKKADRVRLVKMAAVVAPPPAPPVPPADAAAAPEKR